MKKDQDTHRPSPADEAAETDTRRKILEAALAEFTHHGVTGARVDRIAREAGVNKALLYYYFNSKQRLYEESLKAVFAHVVSSVRSRIQEGVDLEQSLRGAAEQYLEVFLERSEMPRLLLRELADPDSTLIKQLAQTVIDSGVPQRIGELLERGMADGSIRKIDPKQATMSFITMQIGYFLMRPLITKVYGLEDDRQFAIERKDAVVDLFLNGVKSR